MSTQRILALAAAAAGLFASSPARAQTPVGAIALDQLEPAPAGDPFFGVPSPAVGGHLVPRGFVMFDYAMQPLAITIGSTTSSIVGYQAHVHAGASLALWDRLLVSASFPVAVAQGGDDPAIGDVQVTSPSSAGVGDLRVGLRVRLFGEPDEVFQVGVAGNVHVPTGSAGSFTGEGGVRISPQLLTGGRLFDRLVWSASVGAMFRDSQNPATITYGGGAAVMLFDDRLQIGPEVYASTPLQDGFLGLTDTRFVPRGTTTNAELLLGVRARVVSGLVVGAAAGPGLSDAIGTPPFRAVGMIAWSPAATKQDAEQPKTLDTDADGVLDTADACPYAFGVKSADPKRDGCPVQDRDEDGVADPEDACPDAAGVTDGDAKQRGCPPDRDGDGVPDLIDACADEKGDPLANGCPAAATGTGGTQAVASATSDTDGDGVLDAADACPRDKGASSADAAASGCPKFVRVTDAEITTLAQVKFKAGDPPPVDSASDALLNEVREAILQHPELLKIEVQAHTDNVGDANYNQKVSKARAEAVRKWLVDHGVPADRVVARGYGPSKPIADNKTADGRAKNKRVVFVVLEKK